MDITLKIIHCFLLIMWVLPTIRLMLFDENKLDRTGNIIYYSILLLMISIIGYNVYNLLK